MVESEGRIVERKVSLSEAGLIARNGEQQVLRVYRSLKNIQLSK